jgi:acetate kinase
MALRMIRRLMTAVPLIACFDTAFFSGLPAAAPLTGAKGLS